MGLITHDQLQQTINTMTDAQNTIENAKSQLVSLGVKKLSVIRARNQQNEQRDQAILEQTEKISLLKNQKERGTDVKSPYRGLVVQVPFFQGQIVSRGQTLVQVEHDDVELVVMIPLDKGS
ncbi:MAG: biotin/lipoyl-binding protein, partial [Candidatus Lindowbacteria bacterium]|nr:biotin/lipoyl-binding protein [Candidatus Lindowbacteria bacterium]